MTQSSHLTVSGTDFSYVNALLEEASEDTPRLGDTVDLKDSDITLKSGKMPEQRHAKVEAVGEETLSLRAEGEPEAFEVERDGYFSVDHSPSIAAVFEEHLRRPSPDGVAYADDGIPGELRERLRAQIQRLADSEPVDHHPGSGTRVRDLVHPSLYPYIEGRSRSTGALPENAAPEYDRFGRPFEGSRYQWLPTPFQIDSEGAVTIASYINNLDREKYGDLYGSLGDLFRAALPMIEGVLGYVSATKFWKEECEDVEHEGELPEPDGKEAIQISPRSVRGTELQVIPKIVDYDLEAGDTHEGVWHVEGMSHEHIVATCVTILDRSECLEGGELSFKRPYTIEEAGRLFWNIEQVRPRPVEALVDEGTIPLGTVATPAGRVLVFPNSHIHKLNKLSVSGEQGRGRRRVIVFWIVDPDVRIPSTREVPPQQGVIPHEEALAARLALMEERRLHKTSFNPRAVSLCEH